MALASCGALMPTLAAATAGAGQKAGLSNIYLFAVQRADSLDWENALCLDQPHQISKTGPFGRESKFALFF